MMGPRDTNRAVDGRGNELDRAIRAWKRSATNDDRLRIDATEAIFREFRRLHASGEQPVRHATLFLPAARWAWAAAVPVFALSVLVASIVLTQGPLKSGALVAHHPRVEVTKSGDDVVFVIRNGKRTHRISKLTDPSSTGKETFTTTTGQFRDRLDSDARIVYYRID